MDVILTALRDFVVALAFSWLGVSLQSAEERPQVREPARPAQTCPAGASACQSAGPAYRADCEG